ncbi:selenium metabolism protein YedF [Urinicoccus massiliensis]|uniref:Selenium metabolism protein YedF n=1 Tax=Urinicoccus massiliensis TaxID=1723382 RepID=A0A8H2M5I4_9FIRM|nr:sulfurtransferase-like selenium metabolism protein YedF [Urinicoccus massiliensis]VFB15547.1 selenium metabolism protein YedF [Urinicoccus massiliensis]
MKEIDALGLLCPRPVILAKKLIKEEQPEEFVVLVDNEIATENLSKMADQLGYDTRVEKEDKVYKVNFKKNKDKKLEQDYSKDEFIVVFSSDELGLGDEEFSKKLLEGFVYSLSEKDQVPTYVVLYNRGVRLSTINENTVADLKKLEARGTTVLSCGLCLGNYKLKEELKVGQVTNMDKIVDLQIHYRTVKPC